MTITDAVLAAYRKNKQAASGDMAVLYEEVICLLGYKPNPGSVYRLGLRHRQYGLNCWKEGSDYAQFQSD